MVSTSHVASGPPPAGEEHAGPPGHMRLVLALMLISTYASVDRAVLTLVVEPIRADVGLSDVQMGLLIGLCFALFYAIGNIPAGYYVDRLNRRKTIAIGSVVWAAMTVVCGTADSFAQLFVGRAGVGLSEAVIAPAAFSMIRDAVPSRSRGMAFSTYAMAPMIGSSLALVLGGFILGAINGGAYAGLPLLGDLKPWQGTMVTIGLLGLPLGLLLLLFPEPARSGGHGDAAGLHDQGGMFHGLADATRYMLKNAALFVPLVLFATLTGMMALGKGAWLPTAMSRAWGLPPEQVGPLLGVMNLVGGIVGLMAGGYLMNRAARKGRGILIYGVIGVIGTAGGFLIAAIAPSYETSLIGVQISLFFVGTGYAVGATMLTEVTPPSMVGRVSGVYLLIQTIGGQSLGALLIAIVAQHVFDGNRATINAMGAMQSLLAVATLVAVFFLNRALIGLRRRAS